MAKRFSKLALILLFVFSFSAIDFCQGQDSDCSATVIASQPDAIDTSNVFLKVADYITTGDFELAQQTLDLTDNNSTYYERLSEILDQRKALVGKRTKKKNELYDEEIAELEKLAKIADANGLEDINDVTAILSVAIKARSYADEEDKPAILNRDIVQKAILKSLEKASEYEENGEWLESLLTSYSFLSVLDPENDQWKDYRDKLTDKAIIKASLSDNPCEESAKRHENIRKDMFIRAILALDYNYVTMIKYNDLALEALQRCKDFAVVLSKMEPDESISFSADQNDLYAWNSEIDKIIAEVQTPIAGISRDKFIDIFERVLEINNKTLKATQEVLIAQFAEAALGELDPHTTLVWPWYKTEFMKSMSSEFSGVGIEISKSEGQLKVNSLLPGTPAFNSGIDADDFIEAVNGESTKDMTLECAVKKITGPEGTNVKLTVRNPHDEDSRVVTITRAKIKVPTVRSWRRDDKGKWLNMVDDESKIGYVRLTSFTSEKTSEELEQQLNDLEANGMEGLILDLRFNSGGYLDQAVKVVDKFVKEGLIVSTRPRLGSFPQWEVATAKSHPDYPLVVLINGSSASASEIVAGALQDQTYKRATLVGSRTYGKGSVQTIVGYPGGNSQLKYTMAYYHLPSGQRVKNRYEREKLDKKDWGIAPDVELELRGDEIRKLYDVQRDNAVLARKDHDENGDPVKRYTIEDTIEADPQLELAILVVKAKQLKQQLEAKTIARNGIVK